MTFSPEAQILILNGVILGVAYLGIYPSLAQKTLSRIMTVDLVLSVIAVGVAGALFWGRDITFTFLFFEVNWAVFSIVTLMAMETPLFLNFAKRHGINFWDDPDQ
ncbi:MAG: hypothetical protein ACSHW1_06130 [Yoonia sp.]|uniref:hypothetical protein n=1 Tax=Yoonia sp. TaxID=2212373 RepID=UPI003EF76F8B